MTSQVKILPLNLLPAITGYYHSLLLLMKHGESLNACLYTGHSFPLLISETTHSQLLCHYVDSTLIWHTFLGLDNLFLSSKIRRSPSPQILLNVGLQKIPFCYYSAMANWQPRHPHTLRNWYMPALWSHVEQYVKGDYTFMGKKIAN